MKKKLQFGYIAYAILFCLLLIAIFSLFELFGKNITSLYENEFFVPVLAIVLIVGATTINIVKSKNGDAQLNKNQSDIQNNFIKGPVMFGLSLFGVIIFSLIVYILVGWLYKITL